jgi:hypothetical protein
VTLSGRRLWSLTAAVCAAIVVGGTPALRAPLWAALRVAARAARAARATRVDDLALWVPAVLFALAVSGGVVVVAARLLARRDDPAATVRRLARRGGSVAEIARATDLAQDAVRDLLSADDETGTAAASVGRPGNFFRRPGRSARRPAGPATQATPSRG